MADQDLSRRDALSGGAAAALVGAGAALALVAQGRDAHAQGMGDITALNNLLRIEYEIQQAYDLINGYLGSPAMDDPRRASAMAGCNNSPNGKAVPKTSFSFAYPATADGMQNDNGPWMLRSSFTSGQVKVR